MASKEYVGSYGKINGKPAGVILKEMRLAALERSKDKTEDVETSVGKGTQTTPATGPEPFAAGRAEREYDAFMKALDAATATATAAAATPAASTAAAAPTATKPAIRPVEQTTTSEPNADEDTELPESRSDLIKALAKAGGVTKQNVAETTRAASAAAQVAKILDSNRALEKLNLATRKIAIPLPKDVGLLSRVAKVLTPVTKAATKLNPLISKASRLATPLRVVDPVLQASRYQTDDAFRQEQIEDTLAGYDKGLGYTIGRAVVKGNPLNPFANLVSVLAATIESPLEAMNILLDAKGDLAVQKQALAASKRGVAALLDARRKLISDADFAALPVEDKKKLSMTAAKALKDLRTSTKANRTTT